MHPSQRPVLLGHNDSFHTNVGMSLPSIFVPSTMVGEILLIYFNVLYSGRGGAQIQVCRDSRGHGGRAAPRLNLRRKLGSPNSTQIKR